MPQIPKDAFSQPVTAKPDSSLSFHIIAAFSFILFCAAVFLWMGSSIGESERTQGVRDAYTDAMRLLNTNADKENAGYRAALQSYTSCLAIQDHSWEQLVKNNKKLDYSSSYAYAKKLLKTDLRECQAVVVKEVAYSIGPGTDPTQAIKQINADIAKANHYLYKPAAPPPYFF